jgi:hypothetical protein
LEERINVDGTHRDPRRSQPSWRPLPQSRNMRIMAQAPTLHVGGQSLVSTSIVIHDSSIRRTSALGRDQSSILVKHLHMITAGRIMADLGVRAGSSSCPAGKSIDRLPCPFSSLSCLVRLAAVQCIEPTEVYHGDDETGCITALARSGR